jgi:hypothetical protein
LNICELKQNKGLTDVVQRWQEKQQFAQPSSHYRPRQQLPNILASATRFASVVAKISGRCNTFSGFYVGKWSISGYYLPQK